MQEETRDNGIAKATFGVSTGASAVCRGGDVRAVEAPGVVVEEVLDSSIDVDERHRVASVDEAGKHEPHLRESGIPSDVLEKLLPGDDVIRLSKPVVAGGFGYRFVKRAFDLVSTGCALVVLAIPMGVVALKIIGGMETQFLAKPVFGAVGA